MEHVGRRVDHRKIGTGLLSRCANPPASPQHHQDVAEKNGRSLSCGTTGIREQSLKSRCSLIAATSRRLFTLRCASKYGWRRTELARIDEWNSVDHRRHFRCGRSLSPHGNDRPRSPGVAPITARASRRRSSTAICPRDLPFSEFTHSRRPKIPQGSVPA